MLLQLKNLLPFALEVVMNNFYAAIHLLLGVAPDDVKASGQVRWTAGQIRAWIHELLLNAVARQDDMPERLPRLLSSTCTS